MLNTFSDKVALITGSSPGIGEVISMPFHQIVSDIVVWLRREVF
jgi:NADP-dependent 3-hydroxy acid dehydrogenase YdfG